MQLKPETNYRFLAIYSRKIKVVTTFPMLSYSTQKVFCEQLKLVLAITYFEWANLKKTLILLASVIIVVTAIVVALIFLHVFRVPFFQINLLGISYSPVHWIGWIGTLYIAFATPAYLIVKRKYPQQILKMLNVHVIGNLLAVMLVSIHFAHQVTRPTNNFPDLGTGIVLYTTMILLAATGFALVSGLGKTFFRQIRFLHPAFALTFYLVIIMHIIHGI
jgi:hypothetical protein